MRCHQGTSHCRCAEKVRGAETVTKSLRRRGACHHDVGLKVSEYMPSSHLSTDLLVLLTLRVANRTKNNRHLFEHIGSRRQNVATDGSKGNAIR
jgi:hypothetical protein